jgi:hypothetical protein
MAPPCAYGRVRLYGRKVKPESQHLPRQSPRYYFPSSIIREVLRETFNRTTIAEAIFLCDCPSCLNDAGVSNGNDNRADRFNAQELLEKYANTYALLIYLRHPGLIHAFREHECTLQGTRFLGNNDLQFLFTRFDVQEASGILEEIIQEQYKFLVRKLEPRNEQTRIAAEEILPINEDPNRKGGGDFGQVRFFTIQHEDYLGDGFKAQQVCISVQQDFIAILTSD